MTMNKRHETPLSSMNGYMAFGGALLAIVAGGVLVRAGHTEAAVDISRLAGLNPSGVICEIMNEDGSMARLPDLVAFAQRHGIKIGTISDLIAYRRRHDNLVRESQSATVVSEYGGNWLMRVFTDVTGGGEHIVLTKGDISTPAPVLARNESAAAAPIICRRVNMVSSLWFTHSCPAPEIPGQGGLHPPDLQAAPRRRSWSA